MFFKNKIIRYIFLVTLFICVIYPLINIYFIYPNFTNLIVTNTENEAIRLGDHLAGMFSAGDGVFDQALDKVVGFLRLGAHTISVKRGVNLKPRIILTNPCRTHA